MKQTYRVEKSDKQLANLLLIDFEKDNEIISLVFDTGASISVLSESAARKFQSKSNDKEISGKGTAGNQMSANLHSVTNIKLGDFLINELDVVVVDDAALCFGVDQEGNELSCDGFIGWSFISKFSWNYDHVSRTLHFGHSKENKSLNNLEDWDNMPIVKVKHNDSHLFFGFDTGHTESVFSKYMYNRIDDTIMSTDVFSGLDGDSEEKVKILKEFNFEINNKEVELKHISVIDRDLFPSSRDNISGLLGYDVLQGKSWLFDYPNRHFEIL
ncbi:retropepsin-like aspartic protease [Acidaminobacter sp. JC074]|uniref:retropepsin-like aspartic protease n=1 Tax=Acidaminobacter sp. JC074 TaxID=2530199 RepID=UPI001F0EE44E|nr:retropepsin-like aspartic protease [Acidaminobacter sp. JC074]